MAKTEPDVAVENGEEVVPTESIFKRLVNNITIEPLVICWLLPFLLTYAAIENMNLEKACRGFVEPPIGFEKDICKIFVRKDSFNINCDDTNNSTSISDIKIDEIQKKFPKIYDSIKDNFPAAVNFLCDTEEKVQKKLSAINSIRNPIAGN